MTTELDPPLCPNCSAVRTGRYCQGCGQDNGHRRLRARELLGELISGLFGWESRVARTVRGLLRDPGGVVLEFLDGRRVRYVNPARFALLSLALWFVASRLMQVDPMEATGIRIHDTGELQSQVRLFIARHLDLFLYLSLPLRAVLLRLLFRRRGLDLAEELVLVLYLAGLGFLFAIVSLPVFIAMGPSALAIQRIVGLVWFIRAVRKVHGVGWWTASWRGTLAALLHGAGTFLLMAAVAIGWAFLTQ